MNTIKKAVSELVRGRDLMPEVMRESMEEIMDGQAAPSQTGAFLALLASKGETVEEITQGALVMRARARRIEVEGPLLDTCSTGGTGFSRFNISTAAAFVVAGAGIRVAKHGNRAVSGKCGSADILAELGANIELEPGQVKECIEKTGIGFLFAPVFHMAMKNAAGPRRELGIRTVFNILGPLTNPASATHQVLGVFDPDLTDVIARVLKNLGVRRAMVLHGSGLDEITLCGSTRVSELNNGSVRGYEVTPENFNMSRRSPEEISGGDPKENKRIFLEILQGRSGPRRDIVLLNAAAGIFVVGKAASISEGIEMAASSIDSGRALEKLKKLIEFSRDPGR